MLGLVVSAIGLNVCVGGFVYYTGAYIQLTEWLSFKAGTASAQPYHIVTEEDIVTEIRS